MKAWNPCIVDCAPETAHLVAYEAAAHHESFEVVFPCARHRVDGRFTWERLPCRGLHAGPIVMHAHAIVRETLFMGESRSWVLVKPSLSLVLRAAWWAQQRQARLTVCPRKQGFSVDLLAKALRGLGMPIRTTSLWTVFETVGGNR